MRLFLLLLALLLPVSAQETMIREVVDPVTDTHIEVTALFSQPTHTGFFPVRVKLANNLKTERSAQLRFISTSNYDNRLQTKSSFSFTAPAGKTVTQDIMVPLCAPAGHPSYARPSITVKLSGGFGNTEHSISADTSPDRPAVLLSEALFTANASQLDAENRKGHSSSRSSDEFAANFSPKQLPNDWLAFSGYDSVLMTDTDWSNTPAGARNAILSWVRLGGQLVIYTTNYTTPSSLGLPADPGYGNCHLETIAADLTLSPPHTIALVSTDAPSRPQGEALTNDFDGTWPLQTYFGSQAFRYGIFIGVLVVFGILVGPVNLFVFAKSGRRHRLFITTPIISLGASLVLVVLIIFQDGFGGNGVRRVLMEVRPDGGQNAAYVHQEQFSRTGILLSSRFTVDPACHFTPVPIAKTRWSRFINDYDTRGSFNLQPDGGKLAASGDWWQSRSEHGHALSAVVSTRGRIERASKPNTFVSTFDFPIETLYFLDETNSWHIAENIATGKPFTLTPCAATTAEPALAAEANAFTTRNRQFLNRAKTRQNHFIAITSQASGIDTHPGIRWKETQTVITGPVVTP